MDEYFEYLNDYDTCKLTEVMDSYYETDKNKALVKLESIKSRLEIEKLQKDFETCFQTHKYKDPLTDKINPSCPTTFKNYIIKYNILYMLKHLVLLLIE